MKLPTFACLLIGILLTPEVTKAQAFKGLKELDIVVEDLSDRAKAIGLTEQSLKDETLVALKRDLPKLPINVTASAYVYLRITCVLLKQLRGAACFVEVSLRRLAYIVGQSVVTYAEVWSHGSILTGPETDMTSQVRDEINENITAFAAAYYKDNP